MYLVLFAITSFIILLVIGSLVTDPFSRFTRIRQPITVSTSGAWRLVRHGQMKVNQRWWWRWFAVAKSAIHVLQSRYVSSPRSHATTISGLIDDIHDHRFRPDKLLLTSGDHFSMLFVRNLGVFFYPTLDTAIPATPAQWRDRQAIYLQTVAYALDVYAGRPVPTTTIVPTGPLQATCLNFYSYPSDTVYGILYALAALEGQESGAPVSYSQPQLELQTIALARELTATYRDTLISLYNHYHETVFDSAAGLIRTDIHMSGAKDITKRQSSFYDNVIFWKTTQLAMSLDLIPHDEDFLFTLKRRILNTFWLPDAGYFLEDLSTEGKEGAYYSSDWLIVLITGFLDPAQPDEVPYFTRSIDYLQSRGIHRPLGVKYQDQTRAHRQFLPVRLAVASYGGDAIWSFWGMEYIKALLILYNVTGIQTYQEEADYQIGAYQKAMLRDGGFPEVYDGRGRLLQTPFYRSIRQTSWVIGFEQVLAMRSHLGSVAQQSQYQIEHDPLSPAGVGVNG